MKYLVYGDDDREEIENLEKLSKDLDSVLAKREAKELKKRAKIKRKKVIDEEFVDNSTTLNEPLGDIDLSIPVNNDKIDDMPEISDRKAKKKSGGKEWIVVLLLLVLVGGSVGGYFFRNELISLVKNFTSKSNTPNTAETVVKPTEDTSNVQVITSQGRLPIIESVISGDKKEALLYATTINETLALYFNDAVAIGRQYEASPTDDVEALAKTFIQLVDYDLVTIEKYKPLFEKVEAKNFYDTSVKRLENIKALYSSIKNGLEVSSQLNNINTYIKVENVLSGESKTALLSFLSNNGVEYVDNGEYITYGEFKVETPAPTGQFQHGETTSEWSITYVDDSSYTIQQGDVSHGFDLALMPLEGAKVGDLVNVTLNIPQETDLSTVNSETLGNYVTKIVKK